jgi:hypothetical protein
MQALEHRTMLATFTVNIDFDEDDGILDGEISLRDAVVAAGPNDRIDFNSSLDGATIPLSIARGPIDIERSVTIDASMLPAGITIDANDPTPGHTGQGIRVFNIDDPTNGSNPPLVTLIGLTLTGGDVGGISPEGGAIRSAAPLVVRDCTIIENEADVGGGIYVQVAGGASSREVLRIESSVIHRNDADTGAGVAIVSGSAGAPTSDTALITGTIISDNKAIDGGGVYAKIHGATVTIAEGTVELNESSSRGGGVFAQLDDGATLMVSGSLLEHNDASRGAGAYAKVFGESTLRLDQNTFYDNEATSDGGGVYAMVSNANVEVLRSDFRSNDARGRGGGLYAHVLNDSKLRLDENTFQGNEAASGGNNIFTNDPKLARTYRPPVRARFDLKNE